MGAAGKGALAIEVAVIEAGNDYTDRVDSFHIARAGTQMVQAAIAAVEARGYRVMPDAAGGCCEHVGVSDGDDYIAVTVYPPGPGTIIYATDADTVERVPGGYRWTWFEPEKGSEFVPEKEATDHFEQSGRDDIAEIIRTGTKYIYGRRS